MIYRLGGEVLGRTVGGKMYESNVAECNETLYGFNFYKDNEIIIAENGVNLIQGWNYNEPCVPFIDRPPEKQYDTHEFTRRQPDSMAAIHEFFENHLFKNFCNGPCNGTRL